MPARDTFSMAIVTIPQVVFPGIISKVSVSPKSAAGSVRIAVAQDHGLVFALERHDRQPATVATTGRILEMTDTYDGWTLAVAGIQRTHMLNCHHQGQALVGQFRYAADAEETIPPLLIEEAWALASELSAMLSESSSPLGLPQNPASLSYWVAAHVPLSAPTQQELLEIASTRGRLAKEISLMRTLLDGLRTEHSG